MGPQRESVPIDDLTVGATCRQPIFREDGILLVGANTRLTQQVITGLRERGITSVHLDRRDLMLIRGDGRSAQPVKRERPKDAPWLAAKPLKEILVDRFEELLSAEWSAQLVSTLATAKLRFDSLKSRLENDRIRSVAEFLEISDSYAHAMVNDLDQTIGVMGSLGNFSGLSERAVRMSVLGMGVAVEMGLDGPQTIEVGTAGLLHDIGLFAMDADLSGPIELMSEPQRWEFMKHPLVSVKCISGVIEISHNVQMAIEQVHEQYDGSGYPRGVCGRRIHTYARILNVVDAYLQLTAETAYRGAIVPHDALGLLLHQAARGLFDPAVIRAFLNVETLFPLGSHVELSNGDLAKVIRRPRSGFANPVLLTSEGNRVELGGENDSLSIIRPARDPDINQIRLSQNLMQTCDWNPAVDSLLV